MKLKFVPNKKGLHVLDCKSHFGPGKDGCVFGKQIIMEANKPDVKGVSFVGRGIKAIATIAGNKSNYTNREVKQAKATRQFQHVAGHLSDDTLIGTATTNGIKNLPIVIQDVKLINAILGKSQYAIKGKTVQKQPDAVKTETFQCHQVFLSIIRT